MTLPRRVLVAGGSPYAALACVHALRPDADRLVLGRPEPGQAVPRPPLVDASVELVLSRGIPAASGRAGAAATVEEATYVDGVLRACRADELDAYVPTSDHEIIAAAKQAARFEAAGVALLAPPLGALSVLLDKSRTLDHAARCGFPVPRAVTTAEDGPAAAFAEEVGYPVVVKQPGSFGSLGVRLAVDRADLEAAFRASAAGGRARLVQEFVAGGIEPSINLVLDGDGEVRFACTLRKLRYVHPSLSTCVLTDEHLPELGAAVELLRAVGFVGFAALQVRRDPRDGTHKLLEVNPRLGANVRILAAMFPEPELNPARLMLAALAGVPAAAPAPVVPVGRLGTAPVDDAVAFLSYLRARRAAPARSDVPSLRRYLRSYVTTYGTRGRSNDQYVAAFRRDPAFAWRSLRASLAGATRRDVRLLPWGDLDARPATT